MLKVRDTFTTPHPVVVLVGPPGSGKTTIGKKLARRLCKEFVDTDAEIEQRHNTTIPEIFSTHGEAHFRELEREVILDCLTHSGAVVSLGGGAVTIPAVLEALHKHCVVFLDISIFEGVRRTRGSNRPLLAGESPEKKYREMYEARESLYTQVANVTVLTDRLTAGKIVKSVLDEIATPNISEDSSPPPKPNPRTSGKKSSRSRRQSRRRSVR